MIYAHEEVSLDTTACIWAIKKYTDKYGKTVQYLPCPAPRGYAKENIGYGFSIGISEGKEIPKYESTFRYVIDQFSGEDRLALEWLARYIDCTVFLETVSSTASLLEALPEEEKAKAVQVFSELKSTLTDAIDQATKISAKNIELLATSSNNVYADISLVDKFSEVKASCGTDEEVVDRMVEVFDEILKLNLALNNLIS